MPHFACPYIWSNQKISPMHQQFVFGSLLRFIFIWLSLFCVSTEASAQRTTSTSPWSAQVMLLTETNRAQPGFHWLDAPLNPGFQLGVERRLSAQPKADLFFGIQAGFFHHQQLQNAIWLGPEIGYRYHFSDRFAADARLGVNYLHSFHASPVYGYQDGQWQKVTDSGASLLMASVGLGLSYQLGQHANSPALRVSYQYAPEVPLAFFFHQFWGVGLHFHPFQ